jgi:hypothetical protein
MVWIARSMIVDSLLSFMMLNVYKLAIVYIRSAISRSVSFYEKRMKNANLKLSESRQVRSIWNSEEEKWYFSITDIIEVLTETDRPRKYWSDLKSKLRKEGSELSEKIGQLKMAAEDGKMRNTDVADTEQLFRLIQTIPSPKVEPFKLWLAQVGSERIDEIEDPEKGIDRMMETYLRKGYSKEWINQRLKSIEVRKDLTDEWENRGVQKGQDFAILTDEITKAWRSYNNRNIQGEGSKDI